MLNVVGKMSHQSQEWHGTFIYVDNDFNRRQRIWQRLKTMARNASIAWMVTGDFNVIGSVWEKQGGRASSMKKVEELQDLISVCNLIEMDF